MECASWIRSRYLPKAGVTITVIDEMMDKFMDPLLSRTLARNTVKTALLKLCQRAHALILEVRQGRDLLEIEVPVSGIVYDDKEHMVENYDVPQSQ